MERKVFDEHFIQQLRRENPCNGHVLPLTEQTAILAPDLINEFSNSVSLKVAFFAQAFFGEKIVNI